MSDSSDKTPSDKLPESVEACHEEIRNLREELAWFKGQLFGPRADRMIDQTEQSGLFEEPAQADETPQDENKEAQEKRTPAKRKGHGRRDLARMEHLPIRETIVHDLSEDEKFCTDCGMDRKPMATRVSFQLGYTPAQLYRIKHIWQHYVCESGCESPIVSPEPPLEIIPGGMASPELIAQVAVSKFADHLPLHRQEAIFARQGIELRRTTLLGWLRAAAGELLVLAEEMAALQTKAALLGVDETPVAIQARGKTRKGYMWVVVGDEDAPYTVYHFEPGRSRAGPERFLRGFQGTLVSDKYTVYQALAAEWELRHAGCWAHVRRKFVDAHKVRPSAHARQAVEKIRALYDIEREFRDASLEERLRARQARSSKLVAEFFRWLKEIQIAIPPAGKLGQAISYALRFEKELCVFVADARVPLDNNAVERAIRPIAVGRKNWLFAGSDEGGRTAAVFYTLIESAKRHGLNVFEYLSDVMRRLPGMARRSLSELLPERWKPAGATPSAAL